MQVSIAEARDRLTKLIRAVEAGEEVIITRNGKPVAELARVSAKKQKIRLGLMRDRIRLLPGWDAPIGLDEFLDGEI